MSEPVEAGDYERRNGIDQVRLYDQYGSDAPWVEEIRRRDRVTHNAQRDLPLFIKKACIEFCDEFLPVGDLEDLTLKEQEGELCMRVRYTELTDAQKQPHVSGVCRVVSMLVRDAECAGVLMPGDYESWFRSYILERVAADSAGAND